MVLNFSSYYNRFNTIKHIPIFSSLNLFDLHKITSKASFAQYKKGDIIRREGDPPDFFYCVVSGRLQAYTQNSAGYKDNVDFIHRGSFFGIISVLTDENHSMTFEALNDSVILKIPKDDFQVILKAIPRLGVQFSQELSKRLRRNVKKGKGIFESQIISVYSPTKETGSSIYAFNLALSLKQETDKKVVFVQMTTVKDSKNDLFVDLNDAVLDEDKISQMVVTGPSDVDFLSVVFDFPSQEDQPSLEDLSGKMMQVISSLVGDYHYVVVDLPNDKNALVLKTLSQSDTVHLLTLDNDDQLSETREIIDLLETALKENFDQEKIKVLVRSLLERKYLGFEEISRKIDYAVFAALPQIDEACLKEHVLFGGRCFYEADQNTDYFKVLRRTSREIGKVRIGLVFGGGAALGVAHIGVLKVLEEENIPIDIVVGSSMGALIASLWATGRNAAELQEIARSFQKRQSLLKLLDPVLSVSAIMGGHAIKRWLRKYLGERTFYSTDIPLKVVAYNLFSRQDVVIDSGSLVNGVRQSIAIPGIIEPIKREGDLIIDGGVLNPLPTNVLSSLGVNKIISVNVLQSPDDVAQAHVRKQKKRLEKEKIPFLENPFVFLKTRISWLFSKFFSPTITDIIVMTLQASEYVIAQQSAQQSDVTIHPNLSGIDWYELYKVDELIARGEQATREQMPQIVKLLAGAQEIKGHKE